MNQEVERSPSNIIKDVENQKEEIARTLKPHLMTQSVIDADSGQRHDQKRVFKTVIMDGTSKTFSFSQKYAFSDPDSVIISLSAPTTVVVYAEMTSPNKFKITAASSLTNIKIKVLMRGY